MKVTDVKKPPQRSGVYVTNPTQGELVKRDGPFDVFKRERSGKTFYDFVEVSPPKGKSHTSLHTFGSKFQPMVYTYSVQKGNLSYGAGHLWARQEVLTNSPAGQRAGKRPALPNDMEGALAVAKEHYQKYSKRRS